MVPDNAHDACSVQLNTELLSYAKQVSLDFHNRRPVLKHLNADTSWLLSLPYPEYVQSPTNRCRYNIVVDPWLQGPQVDFHPWFSSQEHAEQPNIQSLLHLNKLLRDAESAALGVSPASETWYVDAICCSHEFTDHCHKVTLTELPSSVPVFAAKKAADLIRSWQYFDSIFEVPEHDSSNHENVALQPWVNVRRVCTKGDRPAYLHSALLITFSLQMNAPSEVVIYTPHGISVESLRPALKPDCTVLTLLHGLHDISLAGSQLNLGKENAMEIAQTFKVRYWLPTHDEVKVAHGLVAFLLKRTSHTLDIAPGSHPITDNSQVTRPSSGNFFNVRNGGILTLE